MKKKHYNVAVVGATGAVGREMLRILEERRFPVARLSALASERSEGETLSFHGEEHTVELLREEAFDGVEIALFSAGGAVSKRFAPAAAERGAVVIDNTSTFRMDPEVPLVVPEVNPEHLEGWRARRIIANPNCSTIQMLVALKPLHDAARIRRIVVSTYQAVSGAGQKGIAELEQQVRDMFNFRDPTVEVFPQRIAFNCIPCIPQRDAFDEHGQTSEELKMVNETHKMMGADIKVAATCVRVPVFTGHAEVINIELDQPLEVKLARQLLISAPGVMLIDDPAQGLYPTPVESAGEDMVLVGRLRVDPSVENGLALFVVADNLRKGAALNAVQIAELLARDHL